MLLLDSQALLWLLDDNPRLGSKALATLTAFDQAQRKLSDLQARYTRTQ